MDKLIRDLGLFELNELQASKYNGGGPIRDILSFVVGAFSVDFLKEVEMTGEERRAFMRKHGLRD
jgi:hypothetical protein